MNNNNSCPILNSYTSMPPLVRVQYSVALAYSSHCHFRVRILPAVKNTRNLNQKVPCTNERIYWFIKLKQIHQCAGLSGSSGTQEFTAALGLWCLGCFLGPRASCQVIFLPHLVSLVETNTSTAVAGFLPLQKCHTLKSEKKNDTLLQILKGNLNKIG